MILKILRFPHPFLKKKAKTVGKVTPEITKLMDGMLATMRAAPGVGLAAPQVGKSIRVIVCELRAEGQETTTLTLANPKIVEKSGQQTFVEGCLCLPGVEAPVERAEHVVVKALDRSGRPVKIAAQGLLATILQHEIDHLDGLVFVDRVKDPSLIKHVAFEKETREELI